MLALAAPTLAQKPPGSHKSHSVAPGALLNLPGAQAVGVMLARGQKFPRGHRSPTMPAELLPPSGVGVEDPCLQ